MSNRRRKSSRLPGELLRAADACPAFTGLHTHRRRRSTSELEESHGWTARGSRPPQRVEADEPGRSGATVLRAAVPSMKLTESPRQPLDGETVRPVTVTVSARGVCCSWCIRSSTILGSDLVFREESSRGGPRSEYVALHVHSLLYQVGAIKSTGEAIRGSIDAPGRSQVATCGPRTRRTRWLLRRGIPNLE